MLHVEKYTLQLETLLYHPLCDILINQTCNIFDTNAIKNAEELYTKLNNDESTKTQIKEIAKRFNTIIGYIRNEEQKKKIGIIVLVLLQIIKVVKRRNKK
jgi:hypothetical protein